MLQQELVLRKSFIVFLFSFCSAAYVAAHCYIIAVNMCGNFLHNNIYICVVRQNSSPGSSSSVEVSGVPVKSANILVAGAMMYLTF